MLCQGSLRRRSETCSRAPLAHNRYFWLSRATFSAYALAREAAEARALWLASILPSASRVQRKNGESALR